MTGREWDLRGARLAGFQFAEWLVLNGGPQNFVDEHQTDPERAWAAAEANGWVETVRPNKRDSCNPGYKPYPWPRLTGEGHLEVERVRSLRHNSHARAEACREALLLWLAHEGRGAGSAQLIVSRDDFRFYDSPFTVDEVNDAVEFLRETDLVESWTYPGGTVMQPRLTANGTQCVEFHDAKVRDFLHPQQIGRTVTYNQNFHGTVSGQVAQGESVSQTQNQGIDAASLAEVFKAMRNALASVEDVGDRDDVVYAIRELEVAVEQGDPEQVKQRAGRLKRLSGRVGSTALTAATAAGTEAVLQAFGLG